MTFRAEPQPPRQHLPGGPAGARARTTSRLKDEPRRFSVAPPAGEQAQEYNSLLPQIVFFVRIWPIKRAHLAAQNMPAHPAAIRGSRSRCKRDSVDSQYDKPRPGPPCPTLTAGTSSDFPSTRLVSSLYCAYPCALRVPASCRQPADRSKGGALRSGAPDGDLCWPTIPWGGGISWSG